MVTKKLTLSITEMAKELSISKPTAYKLANQKGFPIVKICNRKVVPVAMLERWLEKKSQDQEAL